MDHLPQELGFLHKYNIHKKVGLLIDDDDLPFIAQMYGVQLTELKKIENSFNQNIAVLANDLKQRVPDKPLDTPYRILAIGDSLTSDRESYAKILNHLWRDNPNREIIDSAISGDTTSDILNRFYDTVLNQIFDWAIIFLGTNDCGQLDDDVQISIISLEEYQRNMNYITESLLKKDKKIIHVTIPYADNGRIREFFPEATFKYDKNRIDKTNEFIRELSRRHQTHLADLAKALIEYKGEVLEPDGVHLNKAGQTILCELLLSILP